MVVGSKIFIYTYIVRGCLIWGSGVWSLPLGMLVLKTILLLILLSSLLFLSLILHYHHALLTFVCCIITRPCNLMGSETPMRAILLFEVPIPTSTGIQGLSVVHTSLYGKDDDGCQERPLPWMLVDSSVPTVFFERTIFCGQ